MLTTLLMPKKKEKSYFSVLKNCKKLIVISISFISFFVIINLMNLCIKCLENIYIN